MLCKLALLGLIHVLYGASHFDCPSDWVRNDQECWLASSQQKSWVEAYEYCKDQTHNGALIDIKNTDENNAMKNIINQSNFEYWFGLQVVKTYGHGYSYGYSSWSLRWNTKGESLNEYDNFVNKMSSRSGHSSKKCGFVDDSGYWYLTSSCNLQKRFICQKDVADCLRGYYGSSCNQTCNCYNADCNRTTGVCPYGCSHGWTGDECKTEKQPAQVAVYCMEESKDQQYALLRMDLKNMDYDEIYILDDNETVVCNKSDFTRDDDGIYNLKIDMSSNDSEVQCSPKQISQGKFQWILRTEEIEGFLSEYDRKFHVDCNFHSAEKMSRNIEQSITRDSSSQSFNTDVKQTKESVQLMLQDPSTKEAVSNIKIGSMIQLVMQLNTQNNTISATGISPFNCKCSTSDGKITKRLTDAYGCPLKNSPINMIESDSSPSRVISNPFNAFTIEGSSDILFQCQFQFCFHPSDKCPNRCQYSKLRKLTRRSVDTHGTVFSTAKIFVQNN